RILRLPGRQIPPRERVEQVLVFLRLLSLPPGKRRRCLQPGPQDRRGKRRPIRVRGSNCRGGRRSGGRIGDEREREAVGPKKRADELLRQALQRARLRKPGEVQK